MNESAKRTKKRGLAAKGKSSIYRSVLGYGISLTL